MPERAKVHSLEALEAFRASLIVYLEKARSALDDISDDVMRTRLWLQDEKRTYWEAEIKRRQRDLERKQAALFDAKLSFMERSGMVEAAEARKAKAALEEAANSLGMVKKWNKQYDSRVMPLAKDVDKLRDVLGQHMGRAVTYLGQVTKTLAAYTQPVAPGSGPMPGGEAGKR